MGKHVLPQLALAVSRVWEIFARSTRIQEQTPATATTCSTDDGTYDGRRLVFERLNTDAFNASFLRSFCWKNCRRTDGRLTHKALPAHSTTATPAMATRLSHTHTKENIFITRVDGGTPTNSAAA